MSYSRIGVVTGANKGIGLAIVRQLALQYPESPLNNGRLLIYLAARDQSRGESALQSLYEDIDLKKAKALQTDGAFSEIKYHALDITDTRTIESFAQHLKQAHGEGIDFVINNAAIAMQGFDSNVVKTTLGCNYYSTLEACHAFLPLIKSGGRLVNVGSTAGKLSKYSDEIRNRFLASRTESDVTQLMEDFASAVEAGKEKEMGWPSAAYAVSKAGLIGATRALALAEQEKGGTVLINSCCPGYVKTDMTRGGGVKTPDQGAQTPVMLAIADLKGQTGMFWRSEKHEEW
ncbi:carbonyl reductase [Zopfia rhizophila CBS 207.26]|uniref:Carbonyl reductase n=1 Tax=Zopfia rhizophila CBS 207.26 TaxID=1314779 RepID=A0A6A6E3T5_9PEZI|nr:carbonyl reductase [Zopfia rhizophila CBS 207.26]